MEKNVDDGLAAHTESAAAPAPRVAMHPERERRWRAALAPTPRSKSEAELNEDRKKRASADEAMQFSFDVGDGKHDDQVLTVDGVRAWVGHVENLGACDPEAGHSLQDDLYRRILQSISQGKFRDDVASIIAVAKEALRCEMLDFPRWYA